jgi:hypothetical protein
MVPLKLLSESSMYCKAGRLKLPLPGKGPVKWFEDTAITLKVDMLKMASGTGPVRLLNRRTRISSVGRELMQFGITPDRLLLPRFR